MIVGLGNDIVDIRRLEKTLEKYGERFVARVFTDIERKEIGSPRPARGHLRQTFCRQRGVFQSPRNRLQARRILERHGCRQRAIGAPDHGIDRAAPRRSSIALPRPDTLLAFT